MSGKTTTIEIKEQDWTLVEGWRFRKRKDGTSNFGTCDWENKIIKVSRGQTEHEQLGTLLHEIMHAMDRDKSEFAVDRDSRELCEILWKLGYRRREQ